MPPDEFEWLEEVMGAKPLAWVRERNEASTALLRARPEFAPIRARVLAQLSATDKIPYVFRVGGLHYNVWTDDKNKRGLLRRTTLASFKQAAPVWETVLDVDALGLTEKENWVFKGMNCHSPAYTRCLMRLSRGGADAVVVREFDLINKSFVKDGFVLPEAKSNVDWLDANTVMVGTDFGAGSMTASGYPRIAKSWSRGTPLSSAVVVFEGLVADVSAGVQVDHSVLPPRKMAYRSVDFWSRELSTIGADGSFAKLDVPSDAAASTQGEWLFVQPKKDWLVGGASHPAGSLLVARLSDYQRGERRMQVLFSPSASTSLGAFVSTRQHVIVNVLDNVASRLVEWQMPSASAGWTSRNLADLRAGSKGSASITSWHDGALQGDELGDAYSVNYADFLTPDTYTLARAGSNERELLKQLPSRFESAGMRSEQSFATSADGTKIPYFVVYPKVFKSSESLATMMYGYGGFRIAQRPFYSGIWGSSWLERGGAVVVANIRGGGEFGPSWHQSALKANKQRSYDDFIAVAQDLIRRGITTPKQLGIYGGSNGGLLTGAVAVQRPDLFGAVISAVPLLDMRRYHKLLAGNSWMAEYGNPDVAAEWSYISQYSPYHNIKTGVKYPRMLFTTSTRDDRVHPAHARKMVARLQASGHDVLYFENIEGGHGGAADISQRADLSALQFSYLWMQLNKP